jgi:hypothetical protein
MMRCALWVSAVLAACLALPPAAPASAGVRQIAFSQAGRPSQAGAAASRPAAGPAFDIGGRVLDFTGAGVAGAMVRWGWRTGPTELHLAGSYLGAGGTGTASSGAFGFKGITGGHQVDGVSSDVLDVSFSPAPSGLQEMAAVALDFATENDATQPTPFSYDLQPAHADVTLAHSPGSPVEIRAGNASVGYALAEVPLVAGAGTASVLPMATFDDVVAYTFSGTQDFPTCTAQTEALGPAASVTAGTIAAGTVSLDWNSAQHAALAGPLCQHSGRPGSTAKLVLWGWPAGEKAAFVAYYGPGTSSRYLVSRTSAGPGDTYTVPLTIRKAAPVDMYEIGTQRTDDRDSLVALWDFYQVCTFKASASAIRHGAAVRLSGKVPAGGGYCTIYSTWHKVSGQPKSLAATGWTRVGRFRVASGRFHTGALRPTRTTSYVTKYAGYDFPAFTSVVRVAVR